MMETVAIVVFVVWGLLGAWMVSMKLQLLGNWQTGVGTELSREELAALRDRVIQKATDHQDAA